MEIWQIVPVIYLFLGLCLFFVTALRPRFFWIFLTIISVGAVGLILVPKSPYCVPLVDELLVGSISAGAVLALMMGAVKVAKKPLTVLGKIHWIFFFVLAGYMLLQSIRGFLLWQNVLLLRWICFYLLIAVVAFLTSNTDLPVPKKPVLIRTILWSMFAYIVAYFAHGFYTQYVLGISYYSLTIQGVQWAGAGYALFALVAAIPAAIINLRGNTRAQKWLSLSVIALILIAGNVYDSRAVFVAIALFFLISPTILGLRRIIPMALVGIIAVLFFYGSTLLVFLGTMTQTVTFNYAADSGRWTIMHAAADAITQNTGNFLFGYGIHSHHYVLAPFMRDAGAIINFDYSQVTKPGQELSVKTAESSLPDYVRVTGFGGLLTDIGLVGASLFILVFLLAAMRLLVARDPSRFLLLVALGLAAAWMMFSKTEDIVLVWLMLMPSGILFHLVRPEREPSEGGG